MIVFKYFFKILKKYTFMMILFTAILILFGAFSLKTNNTSTDFTATKPNICIVNRDEKIGITKGIYDYFEKNATLKEIEDQDEARNDALFYREVSYIIYIPEHFHTDFMKGENPFIEVKSAGDYEASFAEMLLENYLQTANIYLENEENEEAMVEKIGKVLEEKATLEMTSTLDNNGLEQANFYYNFANYSILGICIYVVAMIMSSFREEMIQKRIMSSCLKNKHYNQFIFLGILVLGIGLWAIYYLISILLVKDIMLTTHGILYAINSLIFTICALSMAFLVGNIMHKKEAISGVSNVISLGSAFLCGSFVPVQWLPDFVIKFAHILPSYWYIQNNELIKTLENINFETLKPFLINAGVVLLFTVIFIVIANWYTKRKK